MAKKIEDKKSFLHMPEAKVKAKSKVGSLEDSQGELSSESKVKAEMLNDFFSTVFTIEKTKRTLLC